MVVSISSHKDYKMFQYIKCKLGLHTRQMKYNFTFYEDPIKQVYPSIIAHYDVVCPHCKTVKHQKFAFIYENSSAEDTITKAVQDARDFKGDWYYLDVVVPRQKAEALARMKKENI